MYRPGDVVENGGIGRTQLDDFYQLFRGRIGVDFNEHPDFLVPPGHIFPNAEKPLQVDAAFQTRFHRTDGNSLGGGMIDDGRRHTGRQRCQDVFHRVGTFLSPPSRMGGSSASSTKGSLRL